MKQPTHFCYWCGHNEWYKQYGSWFCRICYPPGYYGDTEPWTARIRRLRNRERKSSELNDIGENMGGTHR